MLTFYCYEAKCTMRTDVTEEVIYVLSNEREFTILSKRKILMLNDRYFLKDLVKEIANLCEIFCVKGKIDDNRKMKSFLLTNFQDNLEFIPDHGIHGDSIIVHSKEIDLVDYAMVSIIGDGLRYKEFALAFTKMKKHKLNSQRFYKNFPLCVVNLMRELDKTDPTEETFLAVS